MLKAKRLKDESGEFTDQYSLYTLTQIEGEDEGVMAKEDKGTYTIEALENEKTNLQAQISEINNKLEVIDNL